MPTYTTILYCVVFFSMTIVHRMGLVVLYRRYRPPGRSHVKTADTSHVSIKPIPSLQRGPSQSLISNLEAVWNISNEVRICSFLACKIIVVWLSYYVLYDIWLVHPLLKHRLLEHSSSSNRPPNHTLHTTQHISPLLCV